MVTAAVENGGGENLREPDPPAASGEATVAPGEARGATPAQYRTFSRKLAPALGGVGGALVAIGGLGTWVRATELEPEGLEAVQVATVAGYSYTGGWLLAGLGVVALISSLLWLRRGWVATALPLIASLGALGVIVWQLTVINDRMAAMVAAAEAREELAFSVHHVMLGWGAWLMITAAVLLAVAALVGVLRTLDARGGVADAS